MDGWSLTIQTSDPVTAPSFAQADLGVAASAAATKVVLGSTVTTTVRVANNGPSSADNVGLVQDLPAGLTFVSASTTSGTWKKAGNKLTWKMNTMASGTAAHLTVTSQATSAGTFLNPVTVSATQSDPNLSDNSVTLVTTVLTSPVLDAARINNALRLSWPVEGGFVLQISDTFSPGRWTDVTSAQVVDGRNVVTAVLSGNGPMQLYRLRTPTQ